MRSPADIAHAAGYLEVVLGKSLEELGLDAVTIEQILGYSSHSYNSGRAEGRRDCRPSFLEGDKKKHKTYLYMKMLGIENKNGA